nr:MAG TPA: hypothetical protein [Microviridae sp.]
MIISNVTTFSYSVVTEGRGPPIDLADDGNNGNNYV